MGAGASARCAEELSGVSEAVLTAFFNDISAADHQRLQEALGSSQTAAVASNAAADEPKVSAAAGSSDTTKTTTASADAKEVIPASWGWPKEPHDAAFLRQFVLVYTKASRQEEWDQALEARSVGGTFADHLAEKAFANLLLNKEGTGEDKDDKAHRGIDPNCYKAGKWYRFLNAKGDCNVYVHNYTCDVTASKPDNFTEMTAEELQRLKKLGTYIKDLPDHLIKIYDKHEQIPIVYGSKECCEALKTFADYAKEWQLLDVTKLKRVNEKALEESRLAIVTAMKLGKWLMVYLGDHIPELGEKICTTKNRDKFPITLWQYKGVCSSMVREKLYREEDKEAGQYVCRDGFRVCVVLMYDSLVYEHSSMRKEDMRTKIPNFHHMEEVRCYADGDIKKILEANA